MPRGKVFIGLFALDANHDFHYPKYFSMLPSGPTPKASFTEGFFEVAAAQNPKPQTVAITAEDAEFSRNAADGARENIHKYGFKVVYDRTYPPNTTDFSPIIRAIQATNPDLVVICSYPNTSVGMVQTASELGLKPKMMGGGMVGIQYTAIKSKLKGKLNGIVNYEFWVPTPKLMAPAMPIVMQRKKAFLGLYGLGVNSDFKYDRYFAMIPSGPEPKTSFTKGFFDTAMAQNPKPTTVAIVAADAEFSKNASDGARENAQKAGLKIVYDKSYPPATTDFAPIVRAIQATNPDLVVICSYPLDSVGMVLAANEAKLTPKMIGGAMVGLQSTVFKTKLGPALNGYMNYDFWLPAKSLMFKGTAEFLQKYQDRAAKAGVDPLGYYMAPFSYAYLEVLGQAITATKSVDDAKLADHLRKTTFKTIVGDVSFGKGGEWAKTRVFQAQFRGIKGNGVEQFKNVDTLAIITPAEYKSGDVIYPYEKAKQ